MTQEVLRKVLAEITESMDKEKADLATYTQFYANMLSTVYATLKEASDGCADYFANRMVLTSLFLENIYNRNIERLNHK